MRRQFARRRQVRVLGLPVLVVKQSEEVAFAALLQVLGYACEALCVLGVLLWFGLLLRRVGGFLLFRPG